MCGRKNINAVAVSTVTVTAVTTIVYYILPLSLYD